MVEAGTGQFHNPLNCYPKCHTIETRDIKSQGGGMPPKSTRGDNSLPPYASVRVDLEKLYIAESIRNGLIQFALFTAFEFKIRQRLKLMGISVLPTTCRITVFFQVSPGNTFAVPFFGIASSLHLTLKKYHNTILLPSQCR